jgi:hypothetical protein
LAGIAGALRIVLPVKLYQQKTFAKRSQGEKSCHAMRAILNWFPLPVYAMHIMPKRLHLEYPYKTILYPKLPSVPDGTKLRGTRFVLAYSQAPQRHGSPRERLRFQAKSHQIGISA